MKNRVKASTWVLLAVPGIIVAYPLFWVIMGAFQPGNPLYSSSWSIQELTWIHFNELFYETDFPKWFLNSLTLALENTLLALIFSAVTAYSISRWRFRWKNQWERFIMVLQVSPPFLAMISFFVLLDRWGLVNTFQGLLLIYLAGQLPFYTWMVKGTMDGIPKFLDDAARLEGASESQVFLTIVLPQSRPILALVALSSFTFPWFDFILQSLLLHGEKTTLALGLLGWLQGPSGQNFPLFAAASVIIALPITIVFLILQKQIFPVIITQRPNL